MGLLGVSVEQKKNFECYLHWMGSSLGCVSYT